MAIYRTVLRITPANLLSLPLLSLVTRKTGLHLKSCVKQTNTVIADMSYISETVHQVSVLPMSAAGWGKVVWTKMNPQKTQVDCKRPQVYTVKQACVSCLEEPRLHAVFQPVSPWLWLESLSLSHLSLDVRASLFASALSLVLATLNSARWPAGSQWLLTQWKWIRC